MTKTLNALNKLAFILLGGARYKLFNSYCKAYFQPSRERERNSTNTGLAVKAKRMKNYSGVHSLFSQVGDLQKVTQEVCGCRITDDPLEPSHALYLENRMHGNYP